MQFLMGAMVGIIAREEGIGCVRAQGMCEGRWDVRQAVTCNVGNQRPALKVPGGFLV